MDGNIDKTKIVFVLLPGLQMTDVELDARVTALEENGGGSAQNGNKLIREISLVFVYIYDIYFL